jgi:uncharacterized protein YgbK (DUF1537 family)
MPFFEAGGRLTIGDVHYVLEGEDLVPAAETPFARDEAFGYQSSNLREWVEEKTGGRISASQVLAVSLDDIRLGGPERVADRLVDARVPMIVINAVAHADLEVAVLGILRAEERGRRFLYRTAASFVQVRAGIASARTSCAGEIVSANGRGGLVIVGSHVPKSSEQLRLLRERGGLREVELSVKGLIDLGTRERILQQAREQIDAALAADEDVVLFTSREYVGGGTPEQALAISRSVSSALVSLVQTLALTPALPHRERRDHFQRHRRAWPPDEARPGRGSDLPGVPVWRMGEETLHPGLHYVVFPGNVGSPTALAEWSVR